MKRYLVAGFAAVAVLALLSLAMPIAPFAYEAPIPADERARNAAILTALAAVRIERAWVDSAAGDGTVLVVYELPEGLAVEVAQAYAMGAAAVVAPDSLMLVARTTDGVEWRVAIADVLSYQSGAITREELEALVVKAQVDGKA